ncbi:unnamed protein product [Closterium sp. Naga37s-1]|nr:unnamed protein product [Closterium sp. Naga37s-1]
MDGDGERGTDGSEALAKEGAEGEAVKGGRTGGAAQEDVVITMGEGRNGVDSFPLNLGKTEKVQGGGTEEVAGREEEEEEGVEESELRDVVAPMPVIGGEAQGACGGGAESSGAELRGEVAAAGVAAGKARRRVRFEEGEKGLHGLAALRLRQHVPPRTQAAAEDGSVGGSKGGGAEAGVGWAGGRASDGGSSSAGGLAGGGLLGRPPPLARATSDCSWEMRRVALLGAQHGTPRASAAHSHLKFSDALDQLEHQLGQSSPTREDAASHANDWDDQPCPVWSFQGLSAEGNAATGAAEVEGGVTEGVVEREEEKEGVVAVGEEEEEGVEESELRDVVAPMPVIGGEAQGACGGGAESSGAELRGEVAAAGVAAGKARRRVRFEEGEKGLHGLAALRLRQHVPPRTQAAAEDGSVGGSKGGGAEAGVGWAGGRASDGGSSSAGGLAGGGLLGRPPPLARATSDCSWEMRRVALLGAQHGTPRASAAHSHLKFSDALDQLEHQLGQSSPTREDAASHANDWDDQPCPVWSFQGLSAEGNAATGAAEVEGGVTEGVVEREEEKEGVVAVGEEEEEGVEESELRDVVAPMPVIGGEAQGACGGGAESSGAELRGEVAAAGVAAGKARRRVRFEEGEKGLHGLAALRLRQHVPPRTQAAAEDGSVGGSKGGGAEAGVGWAGGRASDGGSSSAGGLAGGGLLGRPPPLARATSDCSWEMRRVALLGAQHGTPRASAAHSHLKFSDALDQLEHQLGQSSPTREDAASHANDWDDQPCPVWSSQGPAAEGKAAVGAERGEGGGTEEVVGRKEEEEKEGVVAVGEEEEEEGVEESELRDVVAPMPVIGGEAQGARGGGAESSGAELRGEVAAAGVAAGKARRRVRFEEGEKGLHGLAALRLRQHVPPRTQAAAEDGSVGGSKGGGAEAGVGWAGGRASDGGSSSAGGLAGGGLLGRPPPLARATSDCSWEMRRVALLGAQHGTPRASAAHSHLKFSDALDQLEHQLGQSSPTREDAASHANDWDDQPCPVWSSQGPAAEGKAAVGAERGEGGGTEEVVGRKEEEEKEGVVAVGEEEEEEGVEESELRDVVAPMPVIGGEAQGARGGGAESSGAELRGEVAAAGVAAGKARRRVRFEEGEKGLHGLAALRLRQHVPLRTQAAAEDGSVGGSKGGGAEAGVGWAGGRASDGGSSSAGGLAGGGLLGRPPPLARATSDCSWEMRRVALLGAQHGTPRASAAHSHLKFSDALDQLEHQLGQSTPTREDAASHANDWDDQPCPVWSSQGPAAEGKAAVGAERGEGGGTEEVVGRKEEEEKEGVVAVGEEEEEEGVEESELRDVVAPMPVIGGEAQGARGGGAESSGAELRGEVAAAGVAAGKARRRVRFEEGEKGLHGLAALRLRQHVPLRTQAAAEDGSVGGSKGGGAEAGVGWAGGRASDGGSSSAGGLAGGGLLGRPPPLARATSDCSWEMRRVALLGAQHGTPRASAAHSHLKFSDALDQLEHQLGQSTPTREDAASHANDWDDQPCPVWSSQGPAAEGKAAVGAERGEGGGTEEVVGRKEEEEKEGVVAVGEEEEEEGVEESELRDVVAPMPVIGGEAQGACGGGAESSGAELRGEVAAAGVAAGKARRRVRFEEGEKGLHGLAALRLRQHVPPRTQAAAEDGSVGGSKGGGAEAGVGWAGGRASDGGSSSAGGLAGGGLLGRPPPLARATSDCSWEMRRVALLGAQHGTPRASAAHSHLKFSDALDQLEHQLGQSSPTREDAASHANDWDDQPCPVWSSQGPAAEGKAAVGAERGEGGGTEEVVGRKEEEEKEGVVAVGEEEEEEGVEESELRDVVAPMPVIGGEAQGARGGGAESSGAELRGEVAAAGVAAGKARRRVRFEEGEKGLHGLAALRLRQHVPPRTQAAAEDGSVGGSKGGGAEAGVGWAGGRASDGGSSSAGGLAGGGLLGRPPPLARATSDCSWEMRRVALLGAQHGTPRASAAHSHLKFSDALDQLEHQLGQSSPTREDAASHANDWDDQPCPVWSSQGPAAEGKAAVGAERGEGGGTEEVVGRKEEEEKEGVVAVGEEEEEEKEGVVAVGEEEEEEGVEESELRDVVAPMPVIGGEAQGACGGGAESSGAELRGEVAAAGVAAGKARRRVRFEEGEKGLHGLAALRLRQHVPPRTQAAAEDGSVGGSKGGGAEAGVGWAGGRASDGGSSSAGGLAGGGLLGRPPPLARATSDCSWEMRRVALLGAQHGTPRASIAHSHLKFSDALDQLEHQLGQSSPTREDAASHANDWDDQPCPVWSSQGPAAEGKAAVGAERGEGGGTEEVVGRKEEEEKEGVVAVGEEEEEEGVEESELRDVVAPMPVIGGEAQGARGGGAESRGAELRGEVAAAGVAAGKARRRVRFEEGEKGLHGLAALRLRQHVPPRTQAAAEDGSVGGSKGGGAEAGVGWAGGRASDGGSSSAGGLAGGGLLGRPPPLARATSDCSWEMRRVALLGAQHGTPRASAAHSHLKFSDALDQLEHQLGQSSPTREDAASHANDWDDQPCPVWSSQGPAAEGKAAVGAERGEGGGTEEVVGRKEEEEKEGVVAVGEEEEEEGVEESELRDVVAPMPVIGGEAQGARGGGAESSGAELRGEVAAAGVAAGKARRRVRFEEGEKGLHGLAALRLRQHVPPRTQAAAEDGSVGGSKGGGAEAGVGWAGGRASDGGSSSAGGLAGGGLLGRPPPLARATSDCSWEMRRVALLGAQHGTPRASAAHSHLKFSDALDQLEHQLGQSSPTREDAASHANDWDDQPCPVWSSQGPAAEGKAAVGAERGEGGGTEEVVGRKEEEEKEGVVAVGEEEEEEGVEESELRDVVAPMPVIGGEAQGACGGGAESSGAELRGEVAAAGLAAGKARRRVRFEEGEKGLHGLAALRLRQHMPPRTQAAAEDGSVGGSKGGGAEAGVGWAGGRASDGGSSSAGGLAGGGLLGRPPPLARATSDCSWEMRRVALLGAQHGTPRASAAHSHLKFSDALDQLEHQLGQSTPTREDAASHANDWDDQPCPVWSSQGPAAEGKAAVGAEGGEGGGTEEVVGRKEEKEKEEVVAVGEEEEEGVEESELRDVVAPMPVIGGEAQGACGGGAESSGAELRGEVAAAGLAAGKARRRVRFEEGEKGLHGLAALRLRQHVPPRTQAAAEDGSVGGSKGGGAEAGVGWAGGRASDGGSSSAGGLAGGGLLGRPPPLARATSDCSWEMRRVALLGAQHGTPRASAAHSHLKFSDALDQLEHQLGQSTPTREDAASHANDWDDQPCPVWSSQGPAAEGKAAVGAEGGEGGGTEEVVGRKEEEEKEEVVAVGEEEEEGVEESELRDVVAPMPVIGGEAQGACGGGAESSGAELRGEVAAAGLAAGKARRRVRFEEGEKGLHGLAALRLRQHVPPRTQVAAEDGSVGGSKGGGAEAGVGWAGGRASDGGSSSAGGLAGGGLLGRPPPLARATSDCSWEMRRVALLGAQHGTPRASAAHSHLKFSDALDQLEHQLGQSTPTREDAASHANDWDDQPCPVWSSQGPAAEGKAAVGAEGGEGGGTEEVVGRKEEEEKEEVVAVGEEEEEGVEESELRDVVAPMPVIGGEAQGACGGGAESSGAELRGEVAAAGLAAGKARRRVRFEEGEKGLHGLAALRLRQHVPPRTQAAAEDGSVGGSKGGGAEAGVGWAGGRASDGGSSSAGGLAGGGLLGRPPPLARATSDCSWEMRRVALLGAQHGTPRASAAHSHLKFSDALDQLEHQLGQSTPTREDAASHANDWDDQPCPVWSSQGPAAEGKAAVGAEGGEGGGTEEVVGRKEEEEKEGVVAVGEEEEEGVEESELRDVVAPMPVIGGEAQGACGGGAESSGAELRGEVAAAGLAAGKARRRVRFEEGEKGLHGLAALRLRQHVPPRTQAAAEDGSVGGSKGGGAEAGVGWAGGRASDGGSSSAGGLAGGGLLGRPPPLARATSDCSWEMRRVALLGAQHGTPRASAAHSHLKFSDALDQLEHQLGQSTPAQHQQEEHAHHALTEDLVSELPDEMGHSYCD